MASDKRDADSLDESEFGLAPGMIDDVRREGRFISAEEQRMEIMALPKTFDNSMPDRPTVETTPVPRLLPGEEESDRA